MSSMLRPLGRLCAALAVAVLPAVAYAAPTQDARDARDARDGDSKKTETEDAPPAAAPEPAPEPAPEAATPKGALKLLAVAMHAGDAAQIRGLLYVANKHEGRMADAMAAMAAALAKLHGTSVEAFGEDGAKDLTGHAAGSPQQEIDRIEAAEVSEDGDAATVAFKPDPKEQEPAPPVVMRKVDGRWRVPMSELSKGVQPDDLEQRLGDLAVQTKVIGELSKEIAAGKYKNADQAADAWNAKIMQALSPRPRKPGEPGEPSRRAPPAEVRKPDGPADGDRR